MSIRDTFARAGFTPEEKTDLTARLLRAAEEEERMTASTKRNIKKISGGMVFGIAAACLMTVGTLAAVLNPGLRNYFDTQSPGAQETLESGIYRLDRSETYAGWTVTLAECVGDSQTTWLWVDITAPEGPVLPNNDGSYLNFYVHLYDQEHEEAGAGCSIKTQPDEDPADNRYSACLEFYGEEPLRGSTLDVSIGPIVDTWYEDLGGDDWSFHDEGSELTQAIRDHVWTFEDVVFDYPDQTVRLTPNVKFPYLDGTAVVTKLEVSPLGMLIRVEGDSCGILEELEQRSNEAIANAEGRETVVTEDGTTIHFGATTAGVAELRQIREYVHSLEVCLHMRDGSVQAVDHYGHTYGTSQGEAGIPYLECTSRYPGTLDTQPGMNQVIDLSQVDYVTVCGVEVPMPEAEPEEELTIWQQIFRHYWK